MQIRFDERQEQEWRGQRCPGADRDLGLFEELSVSLTTTGLPGIFQHRFDASFLENLLYLRVRKGQEINQGWLTLRQLLYFEKSSSQSFDAVFPRRYSDSILAQSKTYCMCREI